MDELKFIREKYKNRDFIEINSPTQVKVIEWLSGGKMNDGQIDVRKNCSKISERGFIKFLNKGVILVNDTVYGRRFYPFEFTEYGTLKLSIYVFNPLFTSRETEMQLLCKIEATTDTMYKVVEGTYNEELAKDHIANEFDTQKDAFSHLYPIIKRVSEESPDLKGGSREWQIEVGQEYFRNVIKTQIISVIGINAYLSLLQKEILISKITQDRIMTASNKGGKKNKRNPFYRYVVELPKNYRPRKFDVNYILSQWSVPNRKTTKWVRKENAELLAKRRNGRVLNETKGAYVKIEINLAPTTAYRKCVKISENQQSKIYSS